MSRKTTFADLLRNENNEIDTTMHHLIRNVKDELKKERKTEKNVVVSGIPENLGEEKEKEAVNKLLETLRIDVAKVVKRNRLRKKEDKRPEIAPLLVEFVDQETRNLALKNSKNLRSSGDVYKSVYVNRDMTEIERKEEAHLREERNNRKAKLPHVENGLRYGINEVTGKKYYWGVRNGRLVKCLNIMI